MHVKVDTGMARLGFADGAFADAAVRLSDAGLERRGAMTHLACPDESAEATERQLDRFDAALEALARRGLRPPLVHAANSAGLPFVRRDAHARAAGPAPLRAAAAAARPGRRGAAGHDGLGATSRW